MHMLVMARSARHKVTSFLRVYRLKVYFEWLVSSGHASLLGASGLAYFGSLRSINPIAQCIDCQLDLLMDAPIEFIEPSSHYADYLAEWCDEWVCVVRRIMNFQIGGFFDWIVA